MEPIKQRFPSSIVLNRTASLRKVRDNSPMTNNEIALKLAKLTLFTSFTKEKLLNIAPFFQEEYFKSHTIITHEGAESDKIYFIIKGIVRIYKISEDGSEITITIAKEGESIGEMGLIDNKPRSANVQALETTETLVLTKKRFNEIFNSYPAFANQIIHSFSDRIRENGLHIQTIATNDLRKRVYHMLINIRQHFPQTDISLSHENIALLIGATRPRVTEALNQLQNEGKITLSSKKIHVI